MPFFEGQADFSNNQLISLKEALRKEKHTYSYPRKLDLKPDSKFHRFLLDKLMPEAIKSREFMQEKHPTMEKIDKTLTAFVNLSEEEKKVKDKDDRTPTSIVVPVSYASLDTLMTFTSLLYLQDPLFKYEGTGTEPSDTLGAILLELVVQRQAYKTKMALDINPILRSGFSYGFGFGGVWWKEVHGMRTVRKSKTGKDKLIDFLSQNFPQIPETKNEKTREKVLKYEGNEIEPIDPYLTLLDPNISIHKFQNGELFGWISPTNVTTLLEQEQWNDSLFNAKWLQHFDARSTLNMQAGENRGGSFDSNRDSARVGRPSDIIIMMKTITPNDWYDAESGKKLGDRKTPEDWIFTIGGDQVIMMAEPIDSDYGGFPIAGAFPNYDGFSAVPVSHLELIYGMQEIMDWLVRSRMSNVRKVIHDMLVIDPYLINYWDAKNPGSGKLIKARPPARGRGILDKGIHQLKVQDVTANHMNDMGYWNKMIKEVLATTDALEGIPRDHSGRVTATEFEGTKVSAAARIENSASLIGLQLMQDLADIIASNTQQHMSEEVYANTVGEWEQTLKEQYGVGDRIKVSPFDILIDYDVVSKKATPKGGQRIDVLAQVFQAIAGSETLQREYDMVRMAGALFTEMGFKDISAFKRTPQERQIISDEQAAQGAKLGNLAPVEEFV